jgi:hypothetical protein
VDEDEPVLVVQRHEVLNGVDVAERDWPAWVEPLPVVQRVPVVTQNRRPAEQLARLAERNCEISREQIHRRLRNLVDVGGSEKADAHVIKTQRTQRFPAHVCFRLFRNWQLPQVAAKLGVLETLWQVGAHFVESESADPGEKDCAGS